MTTANKPSLAWIDLETTGLDPSLETILEIAIVITDDALVELAHLRADTNEAKFRALSALDPYVQNMHMQNGLWCESLASQATLAEVDVRCAAWLREWFGDAIAAPQSKDRPKMAGSSVHFDRDFMRVHMPRTFALFSHRIYDVSSINEFAQRAVHSVYEGRPRDAGTVHRAMPDILHSINVGRHYAASLISHKRHLELLDEARRAPQPTTAAIAQLLDENP